MSRERRSYIAKVDVESTPSELVDEDITPMPITKADDVSDEALRGLAVVYAHLSRDSLLTPTVRAKLVLLRIQISVEGLRCQSISRRSPDQRQVGSTR